MPDQEVSTIEQVIRTANVEQSQALSTGDPSLMSDTATAAYLRQLTLTNQSLAAQGVTSIALIDLTWGTVTLNGASATAITEETWLTTFSDGTTFESTDSNLYSLVQRNGTWLIEADQHPMLASMPGQPAASATPQPEPVTAVTPSSATSHNWSGYATVGDGFTEVTGT